jgi:preprotein translocase subunit SecE
MSLADYLRDTKSELRHVNWLTRSQTVNLTLAVIAISILVGLFLGFLDQIAQLLLRTFILK